MASDSGINVTRNNPLQVVILSKVNFCRSYAGLKYLADSLADCGINVVVFAQIPVASMDEVKGYRYPVYSCYTGLLGRIPWLRGVYFRWKIRQRIAESCDALIVNFTNPAAYVKEGVQFKNKFPNRPLIHYCPELWIPGEATNLSKHVCNYYLRNANLPDLIIDVESNRARTRAQHIGISKKVEVLMNTLPLSELPVRSPAGTLQKISCSKLPKNKRVLVYTGIVKPSIVDELTAIMSVASSDIFLLWFAQGLRESVESAQRQMHRVLGGHRVRVCESVSRPVLLGALHEADAGLIAYSCQKVKTANQKYAAPTKLFEYIALGLPVVSFGNPSIKDLVEKFDLGEVSVLDTPESLGEAINKLFRREDYDRLRSHVSNVFSNELCYEKTSRRVLGKIGSQLRADICE